MLYKLRLKVDLSGIITLSVFWFSALSKMITNIIIYQS